MSAVAVRSAADTQPGPSSQGTGALTHGKLVAGAGGTYLPIIPAGITPGGSDPGNPLEIPPPGADPQGMTCPVVHRFHVGRARRLVAGSSRCFPSSQRSRRTQRADTTALTLASAMRSPAAIPPGGNPAELPSEAPPPRPTSAGHVVAVTAFLRSRGTWVDAQPVAPYGGSCQGATFASALRTWRVMQPHRSRRPTCSARHRSRSGRISPRR